MSMKSTIFFMLISTIVFSQGNFILCGGLNISSMEVPTDISIETAPRYGFNVGFNYETQLDTMLSFLTGALFETRGLTMETKNTNKTTGHLNLNYLQVPLIGQVNMYYNFGIINVFMGPEIGLLLMANSSIDSDIYSRNEQHDEDVKDDYNTIECGVIFGIGYEYKFKTGAIIFRPSYHYGITKAFKERIDYDVEGSRHRNIKVQIGYKVNVN